jgi:hypothetical protein
MHMVHQNVSLVTNCSSRDGAALVILPTVGGEILVPGFAKFA